jgi:hypothetical protein
MTWDGKNTTHKDGEIGGVFGLFGFTALYYIVSEQIMDRRQNHFF